MTHSHVRWCIRTWRMTHSHVTYESCDIWHVTWRMHMWRMTHSHVTYDSFTRDTWLTWHMTCDVTHSHVTYDSFTCDIWLLHMWHDWFTCDMWLVHMWDDSFICDMTQNIHSECVHCVGKNNSCNYLDREYAQLLWYSQWVVSMPKYFWWGKYIATILIVRIRHYFLIHSEWAQLFWWIKIFARIYIYIYI